MQYFHYQAERDTARLTRVIHETAEAIDKQTEPYGARTPEQEREYSRLLFKSLRERLQRRNDESFLIAVSSRWDLSYPTGGIDMPTIQKIYEASLPLIKAGNLEKNHAVDLQTSDGTYVARMVEISSKSNIRGKYIISYAPVSNNSQLISRIGKLMGLITLGCLALSVITVWMVTGSIVKPLNQICCHAEKIGDGNYRSIEEQYPIEE